MAKTISLKDIKAGHTFYVITVENRIEAYRIIKRKGMKFAVESEGGTIAGELIGLIVHKATKFKSRRAAKSSAKLCGITIIK